MTVRQILLGAYAKSKKAQPSQIATEATELKGVVYRALVGLFAAAARVNPLFFGESETVAFASGGWAKPTDAELVFRIEDPNGNEVVVVPFDDRAIEAGARPAVYQLGSTFHGAGNTGDPKSGNLTFYYSRLPEEPSTVESPIDAAWPERFNELLMHEVAIYLNVKDADPSRVPELQHLRAERDRWAQLYVDHLEHLAANGVSNAPPTRQFPGRSTVPIGSLLAGG